MNASIFPLSTPHRFESAVQIYNQATNSSYRFEVPISRLPDAMQVVATCRIATDLGFVFGDQVHPYRVQLQFDQPVSSIRVSFTRSGLTNNMGIYNKGTNANSMATDDAWNVRLICYWASP